MDKQRKIISFENLSPELRKDLIKAFPNGFAGKTEKIVTPKETLTVVRFETKDAIYMVKVKLSEKKSVDDDDDDDFGGDDFGVPDAVGGKDDSFDSDDDDDEEEEYDTAEESDEDGDDDED